ncbi:DoxX family protein [Guptibacillus algicola]|uniref:DoxX family protein n=1 Tax=Guptibacillus algicola TaxID=225844 RepID=UPI001CD40A69|nr:DoxX family protein [Alkalihalobacillus algicola]
MVMNWFRNNAVAASLLAIIRVYVGYTFLTAGWGKISGDEKFDASGFLAGGIEKSTGEHPAVQGWYASFLENVALPNVSFINVLVPWGEFLVGIALILGILTTFSAFMGLIMNVNFLLAGAISTNPNLMIMEFLLLVGGWNAGRIGLDYFLIKLREKRVGSEEREVAA